MSIKNEEFNEHISFHMIPNPLCEFCMNPQDEYQRGRDDMKKEIIQLIENINDIKDI